MDKINREAAHLTREAGGAGMGNAGCGLPTSPCESVMSAIEYSWHSTPELWCATRPGYDGAPDARCPIGFGRTKEEAAAELLEHEEALADMRFATNRRPD